MKAISFGKEPVALRSAVLRMPHQTNPRVLRLVDQDIQLIDKLPDELCELVENLYLSNNFLRSLENIEQFSRLAVLSLSNNLLRYLDDLQPLQHLTLLTRLSLLGNAVVHMPYYREHVTSLCPSLGSLDDKTVSADERARLPVAIAEAKSRYSQLQQLELQLCMLRHLAGLAACHSAMRKGVFRRCRCSLSAQCFAHVGA